MFLSSKIPREKHKKIRCGQWWKICGKMCGKLLDLPTFAQFKKVSDGLVVKLKSSYNKTRRECEKSLFIIRFFTVRDNFFGKILLI